MSTDLIALLEEIISRLPDGDKTDLYAMLETLKGGA